MSGLASFDERLQQTHLTKKGALIAQYIRENHGRVTKMAANEIAQTLDISEITIIRFAQQLGYSGYRDLQRDLQEILEDAYHQQPQGALSSPAYEQRLAPEERDSRTIHSTYRHCSENLTKAMEWNSEDCLRSAAGIIAGSRKVYVAGFWKCMPLVEMLAIKLKFICESVIKITMNEPDNFMEILSANREDCLVLFAFHRYPRALIRLFRYALDRKMKIVVIADDDAAWAGENGVTLLKSPEEGDYFRGMVGAVFLCEVLGALSAGMILPTGDERNKSIHNLMFDMDYFGEWQTGVNFGSADPE